MYGGSSNLVVKIFVVGVYVMILLVVVVVVFGLYLKRRSCWMEIGNEW